MDDDDDDEEEDLEEDDEDDDENDLDEDELDGTEIRPLLPEFEGTDTLFDTEGADDLPELCDGREYEFDEELLRLALFVVPLFTEGLATFEFVLVLDLVVVVLYEGLVVVLLLL